MQFALSAMSVDILSSAQSESAVNNESFDKESYTVADNVLKLYYISMIFIRVFS